MATIRLAAAANGRYVRNQFMDVARKALDSRVVAVGFGDGGVRRRSGGFVKRRRARDPRRADAPGKKTLTAEIIYLNSPG